MIKSSSFSIKKYTSIYVSRVLKIYIITYYSLLIENDLASDAFFVFAFLDARFKKKCFFFR